MEYLKSLENLEEIKFIDQQKRLIDEQRPFSREMEDKIFQKLKLDWNYNSNAIEGNQLTFGETIAFLNFGLTAKGKPFKDHLDIKGHNEAIQFMLQLIKENHAAFIQILIVDSYRQYEMAEDILWDAIAPRHLIPCLERGTDVFQIEIATIVRDVSNRHIGVHEG